MANRAKTLRNFLASLKSPDSVNTEALTEGAVFMALAVNGLPEEQYLDILRPRFGTFLGEIALAGKRFTYPLGLSLAQRFVDPRLALVGDAAHAIHPIAGQGLNLGLRDVAAIAEVVIEAHRLGLDIGAQAEIHRRIIAARDRGAAVLVISEDLDELFALADRFLVIHAGEVAEAGPSQALDRATIGLMMAGQSRTPETLAQ